MAVSLVYTESVKCVAVPLPTLPNHILELIGAVASSAGVIPRRRIAFSQSELAKTRERNRSIYKSDTFAERKQYHYGSILLSVML